MTTPDLSPAQARTLAAIRRFVAARGRPPSRAEVAKACGLKSTNGAQEIIYRLVSAGALELDDRGQILIGSLEKAA